MYNSNQSESLKAKPHYGKGLNPQLLLSGYQGFKPGTLDPIKPLQKSGPNADIPGYAGYVFAYKPENIYGKTFGFMTKEVKCGTHYRTRPHFDEDWHSVCKESFADPGKTDGSHHLVPTKKVFKVWKSWDVDMDNIYATSLRDRTEVMAQKNPILHDPDMANGKHGVAGTLKFKSVLQRSQEAKAQGMRLRIPDPIVGYQGFDRQVAAGNVHAVDYQKGREQARFRVRKLDKVRRREQGDEQVSKTSSQMTKEYKGYEPVTGYGGFGRRVHADNLHGSTFQKIRKLSELSMEKLRYWKGRETELSAVQATKK